MANSIEEKLNSFFSSYKKQTFEKGELLVRADDDPAGIFYLVDGTVKQYIISQKGEELIVNLYKPGSFFPMTWGLANEKNNYYFEALTNVHILRAPKEEVVEFLKNNSDVLFDLTTRIFRGLDGLLLKMSHFMSGSAYNRLIVEIIIFAKRFGLHSQQDDSIAVAITETELAAHVGLTRETVSREIALLKKHGLVSFRKGELVIHSLDLLEAELSKEAN